MWWRRSAAGAQPTYPQDVPGIDPEMRDEGGRPVRVLLLGKPGCHLCEDARAVVQAVTDDLGVGWAERSVLEDPELVQRYGEQIPVTFVDGRRHDYWRVDAQRLRAALQG